MNERQLRSAVDLAARIGKVMVMTADATGLPHAAVAGRLDQVSDSEVAVTEWFCPGTVANLQINPRMALVVWDADSDEGYQLLGRLQRVQDYAVMDGYEESASRQAVLPQVQRQLVVEVDKVLRFSLAPHADVEEC